MKIYKVGGKIRDQLLGIKSYDSDYVIFEADEKQLLEKLPDIKKIGKKKPVYISKGNEYTISEFESIEKDLESRDLTINAIAKSEEDKIISHPKALKDIEEKILRPVSIKNFFDDPLRVFRAARFSAVFPDFKVSEELINAMKLTKEKGLTKNISAERVGNELRKAFEAKRPENFISLLNDTGNLSPWFKEFENADKIPAGPEKFHGKNTVFDHTLDCMQKVYGSSLLVWMAFCHDLGKIKTPKEILPSHYGHEKTGARLANNIGKRLKLPSKFIKAGITSAKYHMKTGVYNELKPSTRVKLLMELYNKGFLREVFIITNADKGIDYFDQAEKDLEKILKIKLPEEKKELGKKSGEILFQMRCEALQDKFSY
ncbi:MAG: HD domain-containing protein [Desulforegulaceae bacterium]|nr:HD domain-containing protein [Desulforegulaceae bacterium]